jgi:hypothetical protein
LPSTDGNVEGIVLFGDELESGELYCRVKLPPLPSGIFLTSVLAVDIYDFIYFNVSPLLDKG